MNIITIERNIKKACQNEEYCEDYVLLLVYIDFDEVLENI